MDILRGYTKTAIDGFGEFYVKHLDLISAEEIDERKLQHEEHAKSRGLPTEEDKIKCFLHTRHPVYLNDNGYNYMWRHLIKFALHTNIQMLFMIPPVT